MSSSDSAKHSSGLEDSVREKEKKRRAQAGQANLPFSRPDERIVEMLSTGDSLYAISNYGTFQILTADEIDPEVEGINIPWVVRMIFSHGSREPIVARTLLQVEEMRGKIIVSQPLLQETYKQAAAIVMRIMECHAYETVKREIESIHKDIHKDIQENYEKMRAGPSAIVIPYLASFDGEAKAFFGSAKRCLVEITRA